MYDSDQYQIKDSVVHYFDPTNPMAVQWGYHNFEKYPIKFKIGPIFYVESEIRNDFGFGPRR